MHRPSACALRAQLPCAEKRSNFRCLLSVPASAFPRAGEQRLCPFVASYLASGPGSMTACGLSAPTSRCAILDLQGEEMFCRTKRLVFSEASMTYQYLQIARQDGITTLRLDRPERFNS